jgi:hypothetical protein
MTVPRPPWAAEIKDRERIFERHSDHGYHIFWQLCHYAVHPHQAFDITSYDREPILEATLDKRWAREFHAAMLASDASQLVNLLQRRISTLPAWTWRKVKTLPDSMARPCAT